MKTFNIILVLMAALVSSAYANDGKYEAAMKKNIQSVYQARTLDEYQQAVNAFDRIAMAEKTKWEPHYYSAFGCIMMANQEKDAAKKDAYLDLAVAAIEKAKAIAPQESEVIALEGFAYMIRVTVDPASRGPQVAPLAMQTLGKASALDPENPRALALSAQMQFGTAQFFGSSTAEACAVVTRSLEKFDTFKSDNPLAPQWGKPMAEQLKEQCK
jgi:cytochrome c-type biogenesis protein CcmH/NrfG